MSRRRATWRRSGRPITKAARPVDVASAGTGTRPNRIRDDTADSPFVPIRVDIDVDGLRTDLIGIAVGWLGTDNAAPVVEAIAATRPGVHDFVSTIAWCREMEIAGRGDPLVRAMTREMHYHATEILCGV